jgi:hypothetical protein
MAVLSRRIFLSVSAGLVAVLCANLALSQVAQPPPGRRVALSGYDPVAYFADGRPKKGSTAYWFPFDDAVYLFSSEKHRAMFAADPSVTPRNTRASARRGCRRATRPSPTPRPG